MRCQMPTCGETHNRDTIRITVPCIRVFINEFHCRGNFPELRWISIGRSRIFQDKNIEAIRKEIKRNRFLLTFTAKFISAARANQQTWTSFIDATHFRQIVWQIGCQCCITAVLSKFPIKVLQMKDLVSHLSSSTCSLPISQCFNHSSAISVAPT